MAFQKGTATVTLEVRASPGAFLAADPLAVAVDRGDPAIFNLTATPLNGFTDPIWLRCVNLAGGHGITPNPVPAGGGSAVLTIDTEGWSPGPAFEIGIEAVDALPDGEEPAVL